MGAEIERIVDRKSIRGRVHYLVVWRGFGEENNTWESRMDLVADGYSNVIRDYENSRKDGDEDAAAAPSTRSPSRGRSPARGKSPSKSSKSPSRGRGRPRSSSTGRSPSASRRRSSSKSREASKSTNTESGDSSGRRSPRKADKTATAKADEKNDDDEALRKALASLDQPLSASATQPAATNGEAKPISKVELSYEDTKPAEKTAETPMKTKRVDSDIAPANNLQDLWTKLNEGNWLLWFMSVFVVGASLLASQLLPAVDEQDAGVAVGDVEAAQALSNQWRLWLPFLTPTVALLLVLNQRDARSLVKWTAIALAWRVAAELSMFFEFAQLAIGAVAVSYTALVIVLVAIARSDDVRSHSTLAMFVVGALALALADSWIVQTQNVALSSRVSLMSASVLALALSPALTATTEED